MPRPPIALVFRSPLLIAVAVLVAACGLTAVTGPRSWTSATNDTEGHDAVVSVTDRSGRVLDVEVDPIDAPAAGGGVAVVPGQPNSLDVPWTGGACDKWTAIDIEAAGAGLAISVTLTPDDRPCDAMGVIRTLRLKLNGPVPPAMVAVRQ